MFHRFALVLGFGALALALAGCSAESGGRRSAARRRQGIYKVGQPYQIDGTWYYPAEDWTYDETGIASWYGEQFHGKYTANGEIFDLNALTAAHRTLPMPSVVQVTNLDNGRSIELRVNDRGPYARGRIIDLSRRAAQLLGFEGKAPRKCGCRSWCRNRSRWQASPSARRRAEIGRGAAASRAGRPGERGNAAAAARRCRVAAADPPLPPAPPAQPLPLAPPADRRAAAAGHGQDRAGEAVGDLHPGRRLLEPTMPCGSRHGSTARHASIDAKVSGVDVYRVRLGPVACYDADASEPGHRQRRRQAQIVVN